MCGLVALYHPDPARALAITDMQRTLVRRGPDDAGVYVAPHVALAHQRLSIIDIDGGAQPMWLKGGRVGVVFNGEIYNHRSLRTQLETRGAVFETSSDTEVLLHAYTIWGESFVERLDGMFAFALWDAVSQRLLIARDRFGIKPLFVRHCDDGTVAFASDIKALLAMEAKRPPLQPRAIENYLSLGYVLQPDTFYRGIEQVMPGTFEWHGAGTHTTTRYYRVEDALATTGSPVGDDEGRAILRDAVASNLIADVPVGSFLSGGLDSGVITSLMSTLRHPDSFYTYSAGFTEPAFDESAQARALANRLNTNHVDVTCSSGMLTDVDLLLDIYTTPFADNAALPTYYLSRQASQDVKVLLSGDGADELFFGYRNHMLMQLEDTVRGCMPKEMSRQLFSWLAKHYPNHPSMPRYLRGRSTFVSLASPLSHAYCQAIGITARSVLDGLYSEEFKRELAGYQTEHTFEELLTGVAELPTMKQIQWLDFNTYLPSSVLTKVDRATMHASVEARVPFLSNKIAQTALTQPSRRNLHWGGNKRQLRQWSKEVLGDDQRLRKKRSFTSPLDAWFVAMGPVELRRRVMHDALFECGYLLPSAVERLINEQINGKGQHGTTLWSLMILGRFLAR
jgi:asparagine synthase (glutamine-hydrolysing)